MKEYIFDIETDGLLDEITKIHCLSYLDCETQEVNTLFDYKDMRAFFKKDAIFIGHFIIMFDIPAAERILGIDLSKIKKIDTVGLSWYLHPYRPIHGLASWSKSTGVKKPVVTDWKDAGLFVYQNRCEYDVKNNYVIYTWFMSYMKELYDNPKPMVNYLNFKLECIYEQVKHGIPLDEKNAEKYKGELTAMLDEKKAILSKIMPNDLGKVIKTKPAKLFKKDGSFTVYGRDWVIETSKRSLDYDETEAIREDPNPGSHPQLKEWLVRLGWKPETFKVSQTKSKSKDKFEKSLAKYRGQEEEGLVRNIEVNGMTITKESAQISLPFGAGICNSVKDLYEVEPDLVSLEDYYKIVHRLGIIDGENGYLQQVQEGMIAASAHGFTNTMRLKHSSPIVNLPKPGTFYGEQVRSCLTVDDKENYIMCGSDISSLEDSTKQHYIYFYDPVYVNEMRVPGFDPHIDISLLANLMTQEEADFFKKLDSMPEDELKALPTEDLARFSKIKKKRHTGKTTNFSATYGAGGPKIAATAKIPLSEGYELHRIYWQRNKAVKQTAEDCIVKVVKNQKWLYNPISGFWMYLKEEKDRFSTLNQSSGVFVFDTWLRECKKLLKGIPVLMQYHDELMLICKKSDKKFVEACLGEAMKITNKLLQLNVEITISTEWGYNYAEVH